MLTKPLYIGDMIVDVIYMQSNKCKICYIIYYTVYYNYNRIVTLCWIFKMFTKQTSCFTYGSFYKRRHPLFPLLALLFEKCEQSTQGADCVSSASFDVDIQNFVRIQDKEGKAFFSEDPELDSLVWALPRCCWNSFGGFNF